MCLQIGRIDLAGARRYLFSEVPHGSLPALLGAIVMLALQRLVLPVVHWMDDTRTFGTLRPWKPRIGRALMTPTIVANSVVNLCGAIGLGVAMVDVLSARPPQSAHHAPAAGARMIASLFLVRGVAWWTGDIWLDRLSLLPAALIPLGALIVTEGILRRHAPRAMKAVAIVGGSGSVSVVSLGRSISPTSTHSCFRCSNWPASPVADYFGDQGPFGADDVREPQHRSAGHRGNLRHPFHRDRLPGADPRYSGQARRTRSAAVVTAVLIAGDGAETRRRGLLLTVLRVVGAAVLAQPPPLCT